MKIEKLAENKIRITLNLDDLNKNNISLHSFMSNSLEAQDFFYLMLDKAEKEIGFKTDNYKVMIESLSIPDGNFILTITRLYQEQITSKKKIQAKRKQVRYGDTSFIYKFKSFDDFCEFINYLNLEYPSIIKELNNSKLYKYNSNYYFFFKNTDLNENIQRLKSLNCFFLEFSEYIHNSKMLEYKLNEYGDLIISENVIELINKYIST